MASIFQRAYDWIKAIKTPAWLKTLLQELQDLMVVILVKAGQAYVQYIETLIVQAMNIENMTPEQKFKYVFNNARSGGIKAIITLKDSELNALIEFLYAKFKAATQF